MAKQTKRQRKFNATGGVKRRIEKGTITNHGKLRKRKKVPSSQEDPVETATARSEVRRPKEDLGDLDIDSFFAQFAQEDEQAPQEDDVSDGSSSEANDQEQHHHSSSSSDDESASDDNEEAPKKHESRSSSGSSSSDNSSSEEEEEEDDDYDDDIEAAEAQMKAEMSKIQKSDPEFHEFLKENEESLLEFGEDEDEDDEEQTEKDVQKQQQHESGILLTPKLLAGLAKSTFQSHSIKALKKLGNAYKSACHLADAADESSAKKDVSNSSISYIIESSAIFDKLMVMCLNHLHKEFRHHLLGEESGRKKVEDDDDENEEQGNENENEQDESNKPLNPKTLEKAERWDDLRPVLLSFFRSTLHVMSEAKEPELLAFILKALSKYLRYMTPFPRVAESMLKSLSALWSAPLDSSPDYQVVRLNAFLRIRQLALTQPFPFIEECLKKTYLAYAKRAKFGSSVTNSPLLPTLTFMGNCLVELYSLDFHSSYQHAFVYIRQLALLLRTAMQKKTPEAIQQVYCWQYINCLKLWVAVLSSAAPEEDGALMRSLIYPLTEIILGTVRFVPSPVRHMPLRFHCIRLLQQLAAASEVFIPTTSLLLDCLDWKEWTMPKKKSSKTLTQGLQLHLMLKLGKVDALRTHEQLEAGMSEFFVLLNREIELYRYSAGFPEFAVRIVVRLRQFAKDVRDPRWRAYAKACIETCSKYSAFAVQERAKLKEAPKDVKRLECLKPVSEKSMRERHEASVEKELKAWEAARPPPPKKSATADEDNDSDVEGSASEDESKPEKKKKKRKKKSKKPVNKEELEKKMMDDDELMEEADQVQEGIDWSDDDED